MLELAMHATDPWTFEDLFGLPDDGWRYEIVDGGLAMTPPTGVRHEYVLDAVRTVLKASVPSSYLVLGPLGIDLGHSYRIPDLAVVARSVLQHEPAQIPARDTLLVVEVVSPGSRTNDRVTKPAQYAAAGIAGFWKVETKPVGLTAYYLKPGDVAYTEVGVWTSRETAHVTRPFEVDVRVADLQSRWMSRE